MFLRNISNSTVLSMPYVILIMHQVRNHGAVPKLNWNTHRVNIGGLVDSPLSLTMDDLVKLPSITLPVTVTCAGNRRKEENMVKKSIGFNWGPCATCKCG